MLFWIELEVNISRVYLATDADEEKLKCNLSAVLSGGLDTTATQLLWTMQALAEFPEEQEKLSRQIRDNLGSEPIDHDNVHRVGLGTLH